MDWRVLIVFGPVALAIGWAAFNIIKAAVNGEAKLFGEQGNIPWQDGE